MTSTTPPEAGSELATFLARLQQLPPARARAAAAILASAVGDAAARPLHWIYNREELHALLETRETPEFWPESKSPFYTLPTGARSCYNHVVMAGLEAFTLARGEPDTQVYREVITRRFGPGTAWQEALARRREAYNPDKRQTWREPVAGPWLHGAVIAVLEGGRDEDNTEMDPFLLAMPHLLLHHHRDGVLDECVKISALLTGRTELARALCQVLRQVLVGGGLELEELQEGDIKEAALVVAERAAEHHGDTVESLGRNCHLPGSFQGALHAFLHTSEEGEDRFPAAVRLCISAGGCNCSRANYAAALVAAQLGAGCLPASWLDRVTGLPDIVTNITRALDTLDTEDTL